MAVYTHELIDLDIVAPDRVILKEKISEGYFPGETGDFGVLPDHMNFVTSLRIGEIRVINESGEEIFLTISSGFLKVENNKISVIVEDAHTASEIDLEEAIKRRADIEASMKQLSKSDEFEFRKAEAELVRSIVDIDVARKYGARR